MMKIIQKLFNKINKRFSTGAHREIKFVKLIFKSYIYKTNKTTTGMNYEHNNKRVFKVFNKC